jgi:hypothetical protein
MALRFLLGLCDLRLRILRLGARLLGCGSRVLRLGLSRRHEDLLPVHLAGLDAFHGDLFERALLGNMRRLCRKIGVMRGDHAAGALFLRAALGVGQELARAAEFGGRVLGDIGIGFGLRHGLAGLQQQAVVGRRALASHDARDDRPDDRYQDGGATAGFHDAFLTAGAVEIAAAGRSNRRHCCWCCAGSPGAGHAGTRPSGSPVVPVAWHVP